MQGTRIRRITIWLAAAIATFVVGVSAAMAYPADPFGDGSSSQSSWQAYSQQHQKDLKAKKAKHASSKKHRAKR